ncbi:hypothetical protein Tco_1426375 [Tanacetum coccineum]
MAHNHYLEEARKKTQERNRNSKPNVMHTTSLQNTTNGSKPNPRSNNQISRSLPVSKSSYEMSNSMSLVDHSRNSNSFSDSKHFVCSTCHKCVFNANHDNCITKFLKEVNSHAKVQSPKTRNNNKPVEPKSHTQKPGRQIAIRQRFSLNNSFAMHEKPNTPRSCLRWIPTGRIFKLVGLNWIPTGKMFIDSTTKVDSEPPNGSHEDITNPYECDKTLNVSACTLNLSAVAAQEPVALSGTPSSMTIDQDAPSTSTSQTTQELQSQVIPPSVKEEYHLIEVAHMEYDLYFGLLIPEPSSIESSSRIVIPTNLAGIFTKPLGRERLENLMNKLGMQSMSLETLKRMADETEEYWWYLFLYPM